MKILEAGKILGSEGVADKAHACKASGHSKITWLTYSFGSPHFVQKLSHRIWRRVRLRVTTTCHVTNCHIRWHIFYNAWLFQAKDWSFSHVGFLIYNICFSLKDISSNPISRLNSILVTLCKNPAITISLIGSTYGQAPN